MKCLWILVAVLAAVSAAPEVEEGYGDATYLENQKDLLLILKYVHQPYWNAELHKLADNYKISKDYDNYHNVDKVKYFVDLLHRDGLLPRSAAFSLYNSEHLQETKALFDVMYNAKDYKTLASVAAWARFNVNEKMFMYVIGAIVSHRKDVSTLIMPPPYEVCPYQFINGEVIKTAQRMKMQGFPGVKLVDGLKEVIIPMNYTGWYMHLNKDQKVSYYTEDVGLNALYYNFHLDYPHWMEGKPYGLDKDRRGELYLVIHQQINARYYLERLSNDLGHIPHFSWREPIKSGYNPALMMVNGKQFRSRPNFYSLYENERKFVQEAEDRERRIRDIIDQGFFEYKGEKISIAHPEDVNTLGNLLQGNPDGSDLHHNFHNHIIPSFLENYATAARDPLFYQYYQHLMNNYWRFMDKMEPYSYDEIAYPGVKFTEVKVDKIETFFQNFDVDISNAIEVDPNMLNKVHTKDVEFKPDDFIVKARTIRLNHKPYTYKLKIESDKAEEALVRVFIGPKHDEFGASINFNRNRKYFTMIDIVPLNLTVGENVVTRKSDENMFIASEQTSFFDLYKHLMSAKKGESKWTSDLFTGRCQYPKYLLIPKGKKGGMTFSFYFTIHKLVKSATPFMSNFNMATSCGVGSGTRFFEDRNLLFPLDRKIDDLHFYQPNMHFEDVEIYFDGDDNAVQFF